MRFKARTKVAALCIFFSALLAAPNFFPVHLIKLSKTGVKGERFNPASVSQIRSVDDLMRKADSITVVNGNQPPPLVYATTLASLIRDRFYHGFSHYSLQQNWIAALAGKLAWSHLSAIVLPDDILKYPMAACSQQSIVLIECFKRKGVSFRKVGFDHHFATEAKFNNRWFYFDPDVEPDFSQVQRTSIVNLLSNKTVYKIYEARMDSAEVDYALGHPYFGTPNKNPAPEASFFHRVTKILSKTLFLFPLLFLFSYSKKLNRQATKAAIATTAQPVVA